MKANNEGRVAVSPGDASQAVSSRQYVMQTTEGQLLTFGRDDVVWDASTQATESTSGLALK